MGQHHVMEGEVDIVLGDWLWLALVMYYGLAAWCILRR